jgi:hypothetical protein
MGGCMTCTTNTQFLPHALHAVLGTYSTAAFSLLDLENRLRCLWVCCVYQLAHFGSEGTQHLFLRTNSVQRYSAPSNSGILTHIVVRGSLLGWGRTVPVPSWSTCSHKWWFQTLYSTLYCREADLFTWDQEEFAAQDWEKLLEVSLYVR